MSPHETASLRNALHALGFDAVGFAKAEAPAPGADAFGRWLDAGMHGSMEWMARNREKRADPSLVLPGAQSLILLGVNYLPEEAPGLPGAPVFARYALYEDYHDTIKPALVKAGRLLEERLGLGPSDYRYCTDTGPVLERAWAQRAGLGFVGKNAMLISRGFGNFLFLSAILVRAELQADEPLVAEKRGVGGLCGKCTRCLDACPTRALVAPGVLDARRCISYLTIENKGAIPLEFRTAIGTRVYGCDICAEICPWNRFAVESRSALLVAKRELRELSLRELLSLTPERFAEVFRRSPVKRIKLAGLLRNACVAAGNSRDPSLLPELEALIRHESPLVAEHAAWAVARLRTT